MLPPRKEGAMPVHTPAIAYPEDLDLLRNIYEDICRERCIYEGSH